MATSISEAGDRMVSIGRIFSRAFGTMGSNPVTVFGISFLFGAVPGSSSISSGNGSASRSRISSPARSRPALYATMAIAQPC